MANLLWSPNTFCVHPVEATEAIEKAAQNMAGAEKRFIIRTARSAWCKRE